VHIAGSINNIRGRKQIISGGKMAKILIVEDEFIVSQDISFILSDYGYEIAAVVAFGEEAIIAASAEKPDLVLMDIKLAGKMNGIQAAKKIIHDLHIPIIFMTANADDDTYQAVKDLNPSAYLIKPFETHKLFTSIEYALNGNNI